MPAKKKAPAKAKKKTAKKNGLFAIEPVVSIAAKIRIPGPDENRYPREGNCGGVWTVTIDGDYFQLLAPCGDELDGKLGQLRLLTESILEAVSQAEAKLAKLSD